MAFRNNSKCGIQTASKLCHINLLISTRHKLSFSMSSSPETGFFSPPHLRSSLVNGCLLVDSQENGSLRPNNHPNGLESVSCRLAMAPMIDTQRLKRCSSDLTL